MPGQPAKFKGRSIVMTREGVKDLRSSLGGVRSFSSTEIEESFAEMLWLNQKCRGFEGGLGYSAQVVSDVYPSCI